MVNVFDLPRDANSNLKKAAIQNTVPFSSQTISRVLDSHRFSK